MSNERLRGFEVIEAYQGEGINIPQRSTHHSAGYDIEASDDIVVPSMIKQLVSYLAQQFRAVFNIAFAKELEDIDSDKILKSTLVPTGLKVYMQEDEYLKIVNRSSNPLKRFLMLPNGIGIIDQDYYNNDNNEGHLYVQLINYGIRDYKIEKGERIAQGIFTKYLKADQDQGGVSERQGGFGSSDDE